MLNSAFIPNLRLVAEFIRRRRFERIQMREEEGRLRQWFLLCGRADQQSALAQSGARAFTFDNGSPSTGTGAAITDPDEQVKKFGSGNGSSQQGGLSFSFR